MQMILKTLVVLGLSSISSLALALNINTADAEAMSNELKGIGAVKAEAIVKYRTENGPFSEANDLIAVPGIGPKTLELFQEQLTFDDAVEQNDDHLPE